MHLFNQIIVHSFEKHAKCVVTLTVCMFIPNTICFCTEQRYLYIDVYNSCLNYVYTCSCVPLASFFIMRAV